MNHCATDIPNSISVESNFGTWSNMNMQAMSAKSNTCNILVRKNTDKLDTYIDDIWTKSKNDWIVTMYIQLNWVTRCYKLAYISKVNEWQLWWEWITSIKSNQNVAKIVLSVDCTNCGIFLWSFSMGYNFFVLISNIKQWRQPLELPKTWYSFGKYNKIW